MWLSKVNTILVRPSCRSNLFPGDGNCKIYKVGGKSAGVDCRRQYVQSLSGMLSLCAL